MKLLFIALFLFIVSCGSKDDAAQTEAASIKTIETPDFGECIEGDVGASFTVSTTGPQQEIIAAINTGDYPEDCENADIIDAESGVLNSSLFQIDLQCETEYFMLVCLTDGTSKKKKFTTPSAEEEVE